MRGILQPKFIRQISGELAREIAHLRSQLGRLLTDKTGFFLQVLIEYNNTLPHHQSVLRSAETKDIHSAIHSQRLKRKPEGGTGIGNSSSVHVDIHTVQMSKVRQTFQFLGRIDSSHFRTLGDVEGSRLRMMLVTETMQVRSHQLGSQFTIGSSNRTNLTTCHLHGRAAFVNINMGCFGTENRMIRTRH